MDKIGIWIIGIYGSVGTALTIGTISILKGLCPPHGVNTETEPFRQLNLISLDNLVFGGHDIRENNLNDTALQYYRDNGVPSYEILAKVKGDLNQITSRVKRGTLLNSSKPIEYLSKDDLWANDLSIRETIEFLKMDILTFKDENSLTDVVVVNLASAEPLMEISDKHRDLSEFEKMLDSNEKSSVKPSSLYAYAAIDLGCAYINFTSSNAALLPAIQAFAEKKGVPFMGNDGKTGETLVKSALAPVFKYRNLEVMSWQGYNMLGNLDGEILRDQKTREAKVESKDHLLSKILSNSPHTHVGIDYVSSLKDWKTAWDFIHFKGFLDTKMSMQFTWQGCDSMLAAPIVLDLVRLLHFAKTKGEKGGMKHLSCFFKCPIGVDEQDLHFQFHSLMNYVDSHSSNA
ncbi:MAG: inositol-3-phosphate synthase [Candidatus Scalindua rubra]|uniref:Inositol-3-phosphate synthase n=1 Tax=Candidatus Scalindua brodae TaxID=237368 RepID=A0A0B0EQ59_9BACT|nr:MAG: Inositol-3-phosphate synthase [Candidatus Scalindua brodae]MBZ0108940.1 inositol-3-phosphate synthase [Candidatus Scalindua rubra]TWU32134.1 Inositol-3-phosphate synthase [Candidatus Brocadiaceae bacterium S225]